MKMLGSCAIVLAFALVANAQTPLQSEYYPLKVGHSWTYRVRDLVSQQASAEPLRKVVVTVDREEIYAEKKLMKDGKETIEKHVGYILKSASGSKSALDQVVVMDQGVFKVHTAGSPLTPPMLVFKLRLTAGETSWKSNSISGNTTLKGTFTISAAKVKVPAYRDPLDAVLVAYRDDQPKEKQVEIDYWYVRGIGLVKQRIHEKNHNRLMELEKFDPAN